MRRDILTGAAGPADRPERAVLEGPFGRSGPVRRNRSRNDAVPISSAESAVMSRSSPPTSAKISAGRNLGETGDPAGDHYAAAVAAATQPVHQPQHALLVPAEPGGGDGESGGVGQPRRCVQVVRHPLQFRVQDPDQPGRPRRLARRRSARPRGSRPARAPPRQMPSTRSASRTPSATAQPFEPFLDPAVLVEEPHVQVRDVLAGRLHQVLDRLEHARADRAVRDREHAFPGDMPGQHMLVRFDPAG